MIPAGVGDWLRRHCTAALLGGSAAVLLLAVAVFVSNVLDSSAPASPAQVNAKVGALQAQLRQAQARLKTRHDTLLKQLSTADITRVDHDQATGRSLLLSLTATSSSGRSVYAAQSLLNARYTFLTSRSPALTEFVPDWMATANSSGDHRSLFTLSGLDVQIADIHGHTYSYVGMGRLDPVSLDGEGRSVSAGRQYVVFTYTTTDTGTVGSLDAYLASSRSRDALVAASGQDPSTTASPSPAASPGG